MESSESDSKTVMVILGLIILSAVFLGFVLMRYY